MKANEAIAVGVHELNDRVRRLHCDHAPTSSCGWCKDRREAAKTLAALGPFVEAADAYCKANALCDEYLSDDRTEAGEQFALRITEYQENHAKMMDAYAALGLDPAPHGGGETVSKEHLRLYPKHPQKMDNVWYYEEPRGLHFVVETGCAGARPVQFYIQWAVLRAALARKARP